MGKSIHANRKKFINFQKLDLNYVQFNRLYETTERNADVLLNAIKDIGLAVNTRKTKYKNRTSSRHDNK